MCLLLSNVFLAPTNLVATLKICVVCICVCIYVKILNEYKCVRSLKLMCSEDKHTQQRYICN